MAAVKTMQSLEHFELHYLDKVMEGWRVERHIYLAHFFTRCLCK